MECGAKNGGPILLEMAPKVKSSASGGRRQGFVSLREKISLGPAGPGLVAAQEGSTL